MAFVVIQDNGRRTMGVIPILVEEDALCPDCGKHHDMEKCPKCGSWIEIGYGLMLGGLGPYKFCSNDDCTWFFKELDSE